MIRMLIVAYILTSAVWADQVVIEFCASYFPSNNVSDTIVARSGTVIRIHSVGEKQLPDTDYYKFSRTNGVVTFSSIQTAPITPGLVQDAGAFKSLLTVHFGLGAETNTAITESYVTSYFVTRRLDGTGSINDTADALILQTLFMKLKSVSIDGTTWSLPWDDLN